MSTSQAIVAGIAGIAAEWMENPTSAMNDEARRRAEDHALAAMVDQYASALYRVAYSVLRNQADAEDAVQEAFVRVLRHRDSLGEVRDHRVWLIRIVWNIVLDRKRRAKTRPETDDVAELARVLPSTGLSAEERAAAAQHHAHVLGCVDQLPAKEREVLMLSAFEELSSVEIASVLGISESSVRSRLFRARNLMAEPARPREKFGGEEFAMNSNPHEPTAIGSASSPAEVTLRLIASLPAPEGLAERVQTAVSTAKGAAPRRGQVLAWPRTLRPESGWMRSAAAAAIVFVVAGGGWGVYTRVEQNLPAKVIVMPARMPSAGGFTGAGAIRTPLTLPGPKAPVKVSPTAGPAQPRTSKKPVANQKPASGGASQPDETAAGAPR